MGSLLRLRVYLSPYRRWAVLAPLMMALEVAMDVLQPRFVQRIIDQGVQGGNLPLIIHTGSMMVAAALVGAFGGAMCSYYSVLAAQGAGTDLRRALFDKVTTFAFSDLDRLDTGSLITRLISDVSQVQQVCMLMLRVMVRAPLLMAGSLVMAIVTCPPLSPILAVVTPVVATAVVVIVRQTFPMYARVQALLDRLNTVLQENLAGVRVVKAFARSAHENERFGQANTQLMEQNIQAARVSALTAPIMQVSLNLGIVAALWFGGHLFNTHRVGVGQIIAFVNYLIQTLQSLIMISLVLIQVSRAGASSQRIGDVLAAAPARADRPVPAIPFPRSTRIEFDHVTFGYSGDQKDPVLTGISFVVEPGQTVAVMGATGSGKSSLVNLLPRFYDVTDGRITIGGIDIRDIAYPDLRGHIGVALQESVLFSGTIRDNVRFARPDAADASVCAAAGIAQADDFIRRLSGGYDTLLGQRGVNLSGGQKQRIAIARAVLAAPEILILDDSTSAVDIRTEERIHDGLRKNAPVQQTRIVVAQRISTVINADKIIVLEDGRIAGEGSHQELLASSAIYREIYTTQSENGVLIHGDD